MKGFIFAAGFGKRMRPLTDSSPKPLLLLNGVPFICYALTLLKEAGIKNIICNVHYRAEEIIAFFSLNNNFGLNIEFSVEKKILGTGGGIKKCQQFLADGDFVVVNSDIICDINLLSVIDIYYSRQTAGLLVLSGNSYGDATVSVKDRRIADFKNYLASDVPAVFDYTGIAVLNPVIFNYLHGTFSSIVYGGFTSLVRQHELTYYVHEGEWIDVGTREVYNKINAESRRLLKIQERIKNCLGDIKLQ